MHPMVACMMMASAEAGLIANIQADLVAEDLISNRRTIIEMLVACKWKHNLVG